MNLFFLQLSFIIVCNFACSSNTNEKEHNNIEDTSDAAQSKCKSMGSITVKNPYDCITNSTSYKEDGKIDINKLEEYECCFIKKNINTSSNLNLGTCGYNQMNKNGTLDINNQTIICAPFNQTKYELQRLKEYNEPLVPCAANTNIKSSQDCYDQGDDERFCCHIYGYLEGSSISQCYYFNKLVSNRKGTYIDSGLTFSCEVSSILPHFLTYLLLIMICIVHL